MTTIQRSADCGNSPKNLLVESLSVALATGDVESVLRYVTDDVRWQIVGKEAIIGKAAVAEAVRRSLQHAPLALTIHHAITHGRAGAVNGTLRLAEAAACEFCDVYEFANAKGTSISAINSYRIETR